MVEEKTKQVQFRMPPKLHKELKLALVEDDSSIAEFFNEAASKYLKNRKRRKDK